MPVYLVVLRKNRTDVPSLFESWGRYIKGPVDHIELAFVNPGRPVYAFSITYNSKTAKFGVRTYDEEKQNSKIEWWEIPGIDEKRCEMYCAAHAGQDRISLVMMAKSALPFDHDSVSSWIVPYVTELKEEWKGEDEVQNAAFCVTTTLNALKAATKKLDDVDAARCTANDALIYVIRRLGAKRRQYAPNLIPTRSGVDDVGKNMIIRSERWV
jgi:hypothetical protein